MARVLFVASVVLVIIFTVSDSSPAESSERSSWSVTLPGGGSLDLVAVRKISADEGSFWCPDGSPMDVKPYDGPSRFRVGNANSYELVFKGTGLSDRLTDWVYEFDTPHSQTGSSAVALSESADQKARLFVCAVTVLEGKTVLDGRVKVASGDWHTITEFGAGGGVYDNVILSMCDSGHDRIQYALTLGGPTSLAPLRLTLHVASGATSDGTFTEYRTVVGKEKTPVRQLLYSFKNVDQLVGVRVQTCKWHVVRFQEVSLLLGQRTNIKFAVEPDTDQATYAESSRDIMRTYDEVKPQGGEIVDGLQAYLRTEDKHWTLTENPVVTVDLSEVGPGTFMINDPPAGVITEYDGVQYFFPAAPMYSVPGQFGRDVYGLSGGLGSALVDSNRQQLKITPGKHTVRMAFCLASRFGGGGVSPKLVFSNPVTVVVGEKEGK